MRLYMVRHGQSENNLAKKHSGWAQISLTENGIEDAKRAGKHLQGLSFDRIYSSDLIRTVQTAQYALPGCQPIQLPVLREINVGSLMGKFFGQPLLEGDLDYDKNRRENNYTSYGGECWEDIRRRSREFLQMLEADPCQQVVAFSHAGMLRATLENVLGAEAVVGHLRCLNCAIGVFVYENEKWLLEQWNGVV